MKNFYELSLEEQANVLCSLIVKFIVKLGIKDEELAYNIFNYLVNNEIKEINKHETD